MRQGLLFPDRANAIQERFRNADDRFLLIHPPGEVGKGLKQAGILANRDPGRFNQQIAQIGIMATRQPMIDFMRV